MWAIFFSAVRFTSFLFGAALINYASRDLLSRHERLHHAEVPNTRSIDTLPSQPSIEDSRDELVLPADSAMHSSSSFWKETLTNTSDTSALTETHYEMDFSQHGLQLPDVSWNNDAFSFPDFIPSQFLDTDIPLGDLFQQAPVQKESDMPNLAGSLLQSVSHNNLHDNMNLKHPPRFPSMDDQLDNNNLDTRSDITNCPWAISPSGYKIIVNKIAVCKPAWLDMLIPSKCALVRYLEGYFRKFHDHLPFLHVASFRPDAVAVELLLSMAAIGAFYCFEHSEGYRLYSFTRSLIDSIFQARRESAVDQLTSRAPRPLGEGRIASASHSSHSCSRSSCTAQTPQSNAPSVEQEDSQAQLQRAQSLIIIIAMGAWGEQSLLQDSQTMNSQLASLIRELRIGNPDDASNLDLGWLDWVSHEQLRRTLLVAYIILNLNSIILDVPPMIFTREVAICLPSCEAEWGAVSEAGWKRHREVSALRERPFVQTLNQLLAGQSICDEWGVSAFSNYVLIHGIMQKIYIEIQTPVHSHETSAVQSDLLKTFETALRLWQYSWETTWESTLDPYSPKGPIGFNATALLRLAYIRLNTRIGLCHNFMTGDTLHIKQVFSRLREISLSRSPSLDRAVLQCIHALSIPVRVGIQNVARTQILHWGIQHSICHLECAFLLALWMQTIAESVRIDGMASLRGDELKLLTMAKGLVKETHLQRSIDYQEETAANIRRLAASTARLWAEISSGTHVFEIVHRIGASLLVISDVLEAESFAL
jgi:hypothetical protein